MCSKLPSILLALLVCTARSRAAGGDELIPPLARIQPDRPRLLLRPKSTPLAISLAQLQSLPRDADFGRMLAQLEKQESAAAQAMVWLLTKDSAAAERAVKRMRAYRYPGEVDTFHVYFNLMEDSTSCARSCLPFSWRSWCARQDREPRAGMS